MRIAVFHELNIGGTRRAVLELANELAKNHHELQRNLENVE